MRVAAVDIGTNTVRLLIADSDDGRRHTSVRRLVTVTRLGLGVDAERILDPGAVRCTLSVLSEYRSAVTAAKVDAIRAVATSAVRDAADRDAFLDSAEVALGQRPEVIQGGEEARLSFRGVASGVSGEAPLLVIDPGGGSTEFVIGESEPVYAMSIETGSVRLTERHLPAHPADPAHVEAAGDEVDALVGAVLLPDLPRTVVGVGGTFTSLAAILLRLERYDPAKVHGSTFPAAAFGRLVERLAGLSLAETVAIPSLDPDRAPVLLGGSIVAARALAHVEAQKVTISEADILDGVALSLIAG